LSLDFLRTSADTKAVVLLEEGMMRVTCPMIHDKHKNFSHKFFENKTFQSFKSFLHKKIFKFPNLEAHPNFLWIFLGLGFP
jgi:hypothetical protein